MPVNSIWNVFVNQTPQSGQGGDQQQLQAVSGRGQVTPAVSAGQAQQLELYNAYSDPRSFASGNSQHITSYRYEAAEIMEYLNRLDARIFPEIHLTHDKFITLRLVINGIDRSPEIPIIWNTVYGPITVRNARYVLNLDKFMEDAPPSEGDMPE